MGIRDLLTAAKDRVTSKPDDSPEATLGDGCGFTQEEIESAPEVEVAELDEGE